MRVGEQKLLSYCWGQINGIMDGGFFEGALIMFCSTKPDLELLCALGCARAKLLDEDEVVVHAMPRYGAVGGIPTRYLKQHNVEYRTFDEGNWSLNDTKHLIGDAEQGGKKVKFMIIQGLDNKHTFRPERHDWYRELLREHREYGRENNVTFVVTAKVFWSKARAEFHEMEIDAALDRMAEGGHYVVEKGCDTQADIVIYTAHALNAHQTYLRRCKNRGSTLTRDDTPNLALFDLLLPDEDDRKVRILK